ncbi:unnamed protein product [Rotaria sp. Silwood2]|nr:unnamed protein product [Rotaria sp. Silwood2]CAF2776496.1 unnamed protein product [Rotaria sp. Silwood2]CAF3055998.1 unnamed protein product [Rotaria sp. Silwood2]CAF3206386.1 unnamed protein product [Rotaria sp. Silwood2]
MSTHAAKKTKLEDLPQCPYGSKCYRKNPAHFQEYSHSDCVSTSVTPKAVKTDTNITLPVCPFGATCYRKNLLHFAEYSHPFDLLNPDVDSSDEDETNQSNKKNETINDNKKRKKENEEDDDDDGDKTEEYDTDDISEGILLMEGETEILKGTKVKYFELFPERNYKQGSAAELHFRLAESQFYRLLSGYGTAAREELKKKRGEEYSYPVLAFHGTAIANIQPICENGFKVPGEEGFAHATDSGFYGRGAYFSGYDSHCSPSKQELIIFRSDYILPQYIVHYKLDAGEFKYAVTGATKEAIKKKLAKIGKLYKKAVATKDKKIFTGYKFAFIGQMVDTPLAIEALVKRFGGHVCKNAVPFGGTVMTTGLFFNGYPATVPFDAPNIIICSITEYEAATPSTELQAYKNMNYHAFYREDFLYDSIIEGALKTLDDYAHD